MDKQEFQIRKDNCTKWISFWDRLEETRQKSEDNFDKKIRSFIDAIEFNLPAPVPSSQIIYNQAIIDGIARSSDLGREVTIEIPEI